MSNKDITQILAAARFKPRSDSLENWEKENPVLLSGEPGVVTDGTETEKIKFGDGVTPWNNLGWWKGPKGDKGDRGEQGPQGIKGEKGDKGDAGENGSNYILTEADKQEIVDLIAETEIGDIKTALDELHNYARGLIGGAE